VLNLSDGNDTAAEEPQAVKKNPGQSRVPTVVNVIVDPDPDNEGGRLGGQACAEHSV
jgi:hypothetical protein